MNENDVFEWGAVDFDSQLRSFNFKIKKEYTTEIKKVYGNNVDVRDFVGDEIEFEVKDEEFHDALFTSKSHQNENDNYKKSDNSSILILGCGNSRLGEDILHYYFDLNSMGIKQVTIPKVIQCDISTHVVTSMAKRYKKYIERNQMTLLQDDARQFTLIEDESMDAVVDKGLVDALFCSDQGDMMHQVMNSVNRTLKVGKVFMFFSFSRPEYLLKHTKCNFDVPEDESPRNRSKSMKNVNWSSVNVWELDNIFMYRFVKGKNKTETAPLKGTNQIKMQQKKKFLKRKL